MPDRITGHYVPGSLAGSRYQAFVPDPLPPVPPLDFTCADLVSRKERADQALGRLDGITLMLPDPELFLYQYVRKEALLSSLRGIHDSPGAIESYYSTHYLSGAFRTPRRYMEEIEAVTVEDVVAAANTVKLHTTYFLKGVQS